MRRFLALFLALLMVVIPLASCEEMDNLFDYDETYEDEENEEIDNNDDNKKDPSETKKNPFGDWFGEILGTEADKPATTERPQTGTQGGTDYPYWDNATMRPSDYPSWDTEAKPNYTMRPSDYPSWDTEAKPNYTMRPSDYPYWDNATMRPSDYPYWDNATMRPSDYPSWDTEAKPNYTMRPSDYPYWDNQETRVPTDDYWDPETFPPINSDWDTDWETNDPSFDTEIPGWTDDSPSTDYPFGDDETHECIDGTFTSPDDYDEIDLDGEVLNIVIRNQLSAQREWYKDTPEDEVDEVISARNEYVASVINVEVNYTLLGGSDYEDCLNTFNAAIMEDVDNDFHYYDIVANYAYAGANEMLRDYVANLADKDLFPYFDFTLPCWNQSIVKTTMIDDRLYYVTGDLNLSTFDKTMVVFVNKDVYTDKKAASDPEDLQDVALEGNWDYEDLYAWASRYEDSNGDKVKGHEDFYAISAGFGSIPLDALPYAWDLDFIVENDDGSHSYNIIDNDKISEAVDRAKALFNGVSDSDRIPLAEGVGNWNNTTGCTMGGYSEPITHFANDNSVFALHLLYCTADDNIMLREMTCEFGLLPMPKYEEEQENYGTTAHDAYTLMTVIDHSKSTEKTKGEAISAYLQLSSEESYTSVRGYYINEIVKQKYFGYTDTVEKSQQIFDIIADNIELPFVSVYAPQLKGILSSCWRDVITESTGINATTSEEAFKLDQSSYEIALEDVDAWLGLI